MSAFPLITRTELETITSQPGIVLLDFWQAGWAPCRALEPRLERFAGAHPGAFKGYRIDVDTEPALAAGFNVMSIPTIVVLQDGHETSRLDGLICDVDLHAIIALHTGA